MIVHDKYKISSHSKWEAAGIKNLVTNKKINNIFKEIESFFSLWIVGLNHQRAAISQEIIQHNALSLLKYLNKKIPVKKSWVQDRSRMVHEN